jgi:hypothetical protein
MCIISFTVVKKTTKVILHGDVQVVALCDYPALLDKSETHAIFRYLSLQV